MRILIPAFGFEDCFVDNVQRTLVAMGHEVKTLGQVAYKNYWSLPKYATRVAREMAFGDRPDRVGLKIIKLAKEFRPDIVLSVTGLLHPVVLDELGRLAPSRRILWWADPPANSQRWGIVDPGWDLVFLKDRAAVNKLQTIGRRAYLLHEAMNPNWHKPMSDQKNESVVIAGNYYAFRQAIILRLMDHGISFQLYGSRPPRWSHPRIRAEYRGEYLTGERKSRVFGEGLACLNTFSLAEGDSLNCRAFEIAGTGGLQIIEYRPAIEECFEPGRELLTFRTFDELLQCIERAQKYPADMKAIRKAGAERARSEHTYQHRLEKILNTL